MIWGCNGVGDHVKIDGAMNIEKYHQILIYHMVPSGKHLINTFFIMTMISNTVQAVKVYFPLATVSCYRILFKKDPHQNFRSSFIAEAPPLQQAS